LPRPTTSVSQTSRETGRTSPDTKPQLTTVMGACVSFIINKYFILFLFISYLLFCISMYYLSTGPI
jgi:hypothetical protein